MSSKAFVVSVLLLVIHGAFAGDALPEMRMTPAEVRGDDRVAVVVLGEWQFGYGDHFDAQALKTLPPGSVYTEPGGRGVAFMASG